MQVRIKDKKIQKLVKLDAKARDCSNARAVEMCLSEFFRMRNQDELRNMVLKNGPQWDKMLAQNPFIKLTK